MLALGSETVYFNIEGIKERSFGFKSINEALKLKKHLHKNFDVYLSATKEDLVASLHIVVVGGGPSGVELVGESIKYMKDLSSKHGIDNKFITIDLVEASSRLTPMLPEKVSEFLYNRLHSLGVNISQSFGSKGRCRSNFNGRHVDEVQYFDLDSRVTHESFL